MVVLAIVPVLCVALGLAGPPALAGPAPGATAAAASVPFTGHVAVYPAKETATTAGRVSFVVVGDGLIPRAAYKVVAATLSANCKNNVNNKRVVTDLVGLFNLAARAGPNCVAGRFTIDVQLTTAPFAVHRATFRIVAP